VKAGDIVKVKVMEVDLQRKRIALTMRLMSSPAKAMHGVARRIPRRAKRNVRLQVKAVRVQPAHPQATVQWVMHWLRHSVKNAKLFRGPHQAPSSHAFPRLKIPIIALR